MNEKLVAEARLLVVALQAKRDRSFHWLLSYDSKRLKRALQAARRRHLRRANKLYGFDSGGNVM